MNRHILKGLSPRLLETYFSGLQNVRHKAEVALVVANAHHTMGEDTEAKKWRAKSAELFGEAFESPTVVLFV